MAADVQRWITVGGKKVPIKSRASAKTSDEGPGSLRTLRGLIAEFDGYRKKREHLGQLAGQFQARREGAVEDYLKNHQDDATHDEFMRLYNETDTYLDDLKAWEKEAVRE
jgi:hypothetical protein